jgi:hypothetical protein
MHFTQRKLGNLMNQMIIPGFTQTNGYIDPAFAAQAPMGLPQHCDSVIGSSLVG